MAIFKQRDGVEKVRQPSEASWTKNAAVTHYCSPSSSGIAQTTLRTSPVGLANDILDSAYEIRRAWTGAEDVAAKTKRSLNKQMEDARTADEWRNAADRLDILEGNHYWRFEEQSDECDMPLLRRRLDKLKRALNDKDVEEMVHLVRTSLKRDLGGMCNVHLYQHTWLGGTKHLIEEYTEVVNFTLEEIARYCQKADPATVKRYLVSMKLARQSFGKSALMLSGGGTLGMCHMGVVKCLLQKGLLPQVVCGSSAGSIVGSVLCTQKGKGILDKLDELCRGDLSVFQGPNEPQGIQGMAYNILRGYPAFDIDNLRRVMKNLLGDVTFLEAHNLTSMVLNIHVSTRDKHHLPRLLNFITSPNVVIWSAVASSCALPGVFEPPGLMQKNPETSKIEPVHGDHKWIDGSIEGDVPSQVLERLFNVNNFIASQVNPHVSAFLPREGEKPSIWSSAMSFSKANAIFLLDNIMDRGYDSFPIKAVHAILSQKYDGHVTILPDTNWVSLTKIFANPTLDFMLKATMVGEKATWPKLDRIHQSVAIELALDDLVKHIHGLNVGNREEVKLRRLSSTRSDRGIMRSRSSGPGAIGLTLASLPRGRANIPRHRPIRSMVDPPTHLTLPTTPSPAVAALQAGDQITSSSDEPTSGRSSPATSLDDEGGSANEAEDLEFASQQERLRAFLSQPTSPSFSKKSFWGSESLMSIASGSPEAKRTFSNLHISKVERDVDLDYKRRRQ